LTIALFAFAQRFLAELNARWLRTWIIELLNEGLQIYLPWEQ
jgi:hypothetical protein